MRVNGTHDNTEISVKIPRGGLTRCETDKKHSIVATFENVSDIMLYVNRCMKRGF